MLFGFYLHLFRPKSMQTIDLIVYSRDTEMYCGKMGIVPVPGTMAIIMIITIRMDSFASQCILASWSKTKHLLGIHRKLL